MLFNKIKLQWQVFGPKFSSKQERERRPGMQGRQHSLRTQAYSIQLDAVLPELEEQTKMDRTHSAVLLA